MTATDSFVIERVVPHPPEKIWRALTETRLLEQWLLKSDFQPVQGHRFQFRAQPNEHWDGLIQGEVLTVKPLEQLSYRWDSPASGLQTVVSWTLKVVHEGTVKNTIIRMEQSGFKPNQSRAYHGARAGWQQFLGNLTRILELEQRSFT